MNAHEAIEKMEAELSDTELLMGDYSDESVVTYLEALSIILESAKLLHENIVAGSVDTNGHGVYSVEIKQRGDENTIYLSSKKILAIGIEEGADE